MQLVNSVPNVVSAYIIIKKVCAAWQFRGENGEELHKSLKMCKKHRFSDIAISICFSDVYSRFSVTKFFHEIQNR